MKYYLRFICVSCLLLAVNQQANGGVWNLLVSNKPFAAGTSGYVKLGNGTGEASKVVMADAIKFVRR